MATKKPKNKKAVRQARALKDFIEKSAEYAEYKSIMDTAKAEMDDLAPIIRQLAKDAGIDKMEDKTFQVTDEFTMEPRFSNPEKYDVDRLKAWLKKKKLKNIIEECFTEEVVEKFDKKRFDELDEAGEIPDVDELEEGEDPIYWVEEGTTALHVKPIEPVNAKKKGK